MYTDADRRYKRSPAGKAAAARRFARFSPEQKERARACTRAWKLANPEKAKAHNKWAKIKIAYGLTRDQWEALFAAQGYKCASCGALEPGCIRGWHTDHSHKTTVVRGIVCLQCNVIIGMAKDDPTKLRAIAKFLEEKDIENAKY